jgi:general stress protein 26
VTHPATYPPIRGAAVETVVRLLDHERLMSVGVNRPDGWPQVTTVGYLNDGLNLYFVTSRESQKLANLQLDPRVSVSIHSSIAAHGAVGVSMAARASEVTDPIEIDRINRLMVQRWPGISVYCPATNSVVILRLKPELISAISVSDGRSQTEGFSIGAAARSDAPTASFETRLF